jgi:integrase
MGIQWHSTQFTGVRYREHPSRKHARRFDRYFAIRYKVNGTLKEEAVGWASEGWNEKKASIILSDLRRAHLTGEGPQSLAEKRTLETEKREQIEAEKRRMEKENISFASYFADSYFPIAKANKDWESARREESLYKLWINPVIGRMPFKDIRPFHIEKIKKTMSDNKKAPRTIQYALAVVRQVFNHGKRNGIYTGESPTRMVSKPKINNKRERWLTHQEADKLLEKLPSKSQQVHDMALVSLHCGLRAGEIFGLTWGCVDLGNGTLLLVDTKSGKNRTAYMTSEVRMMLEEKGLGKPSELVFKDSKLGKIKRISNAFGETVNELGWNDGVEDSRMKVTFHSLRHTYASWLVQNGEDLYTVKKLLGHSTIIMTERYSHLGANTLRKAVERLDSSFRKTPQNKVVSLETAALGVTTA